jgi:hypothetical protein
MPLPQMLNAAGYGATNTINHPSCHRPLVMIYTIGWCEHALIHLNRLHWLLGNELYRPIIWLSLLPVNCYVNIIIEWRKGTQQAETKELTCL